MCANFVRAVQDRQHRARFHPIEVQILLPRTVHDELEIPVQGNFKIKIQIVEFFLNVTGRSRG